MNEKARLGLSITSPLLFGIALFSTCDEVDSDVLVPTITPSTTFVEQPTQELIQTDTIEATHVPTLVPTIIPTPTQTIVFEPTKTATPPVETPTLILPPTPEALPYEGPTFEEAITWEEWGRDSIIAEVDFGQRNGKEITLENIEQTDPIPDEELEEGQSPYRVPQSAIATVDFTPKENLFYTYGHCINPQTGERLPIANIEYLEAGDHAKVINHNGEELLFVASQIVISSVLGEEAALYFKDYEEPTIVIQTSVRTKKGFWLLDPENKEKLLDKTGMTEDQLELGKYYVMFVILKQVKNPFTEN